LVGRFALGLAGAAGVALTSVLFCGGVGAAGGFVSVLLGGTGGGGGAFTPPVGLCSDAGAVEAEDAGPNLTRLSGLLGRFGALASCAWAVVPQKATTNANNERLLINFMLNKRFLIKY
jgi:hypothetical protein